MKYKNRIIERLINSIDLSCYLTQVTHLQGEMWVLADLEFEATQLSACMLSSLEQVLPM